MSRALDWRALGASLCLHGLAASLVESPPGPVGGGSYVEGRRGGDGWGGLLFDLPLRGVSPDRLALAPCPATAGLDRPARPLFPLFATGRPFAWLDAASDPILCLRIAAGGGVADAWLAQGSGDGAKDSALLGSARRLRFAPARRGGRAVASWGTLHVERRGGFALWRQEAGDYRR